MDQPKLTDRERDVVERTRVDLSQRLLRERIPAERWAHVTLGVVVDLAGQCLGLYEQHDTEPPAALCDVRNHPLHGEHSPILHCTLPDGHEPPHVFEKWPP